MKPLYIAATIFCVLHTISHARTEELNPQVRATDRACLPAPGSPHRGNIPMFTKDIKVRYMEIADIDSFASLETSEAVTKQQLEDLECKARQIGADALVEVRKLNYTRRGFINDPETPFKSYKQGDEKTYFFRAAAVRYLEPAPANPTVIPAKNRGKALRSGHSEVLDTNFVLRTQGEDAAASQQRTLNINLP